MSWADLLAWSDRHGLLGKRLYVVLSEQNANHVVSENFGSLPNPQVTGYTTWGANDRTPGTCGWGAGQRPGPQARGEPPRGRPPSIRIAMLLLGAFLQVPFTCQTCLVL